MESLQVWHEQKKPLRGFGPSLKEKKYKISLCLFFSSISGEYVFPGILFT